jgi:predicted PurR-regulated permease PerM
MGLISGAMDYFLAALNILLIPVLMAYFLVDFERMKEAVVGCLPVASKAHIVEKLREVETVLRDFVKGQLMVAFIMGVLYCIGLWIVGVDMPVLVGMSAGMLNLVPYLGTTLGIVVSIVLVLLKFQDLMHPILVLAVFGAVQAIEAYVITPMVVGEKLGLHPLIILFALVVFGHLLGFVGILLAVPVAAVLKVFIAGFLRDYKASRHYAGEGD